MGWLRRWVVRAASVAAHESAAVCRRAWKLAAAGTKAADCGAVDARARGGQGQQLRENTALPVSELLAEASLPMSQWCIPLRRQQMGSFDSSTLPVHPEAKPGASAEAGMACANPRMERSIMERILRIGFIVHWRVARPSGSGMIGKTPVPAVLEIKFGNETESREGVTVPALPRKDFS